LALENEANKKELELRTSEAERSRLEFEDQEKSRKIDEQNKERTYIIIASGVLLASLLILLFFLNSLRKKNQIIKIQNEKIKLVNDTLNEKNHEIVSGIEYASKFQTIVFPTESDLKKHLEGAFILHRPLEIVSGDLPFVLKDNEYLYVAAVDCIGHGVAASMLSIMSYFNLSEIIRSKTFNQCSEILGELHRRLEIRSNEVKVAGNNFLVSIDIALIRINLNSNEIQFSGANLPLILQTRKGTELIKGNVFSIGENSSQRKLSYTDYNYVLEKGDRMFIFSDGFFHQFGGIEMKQKLSKKRTCDWISQNAELSIGEMKGKINTLFEEWKGEAIQTDDVVFIGLEL
jgi:serine phosphatase RsbU (regulator of sigma subunit)